MAIVPKWYVPLVILWIGNIMIEIFRDVLSGRLYAILVIVCIILILASIGYLVTQKLEETSKKKEAVNNVE